MTWKPVPLVALLVMLVGGCAADQPPTLSGSPSISAPPSAISPTPSPSTTATTTSAPTTSAPTTSAPTTSAPTTSAPTTSAPTTTPTLGPKAFTGTWTHRGRTVHDNELHTYTGPQHCDWQAVTFLATNWPIGTISRTGGHSRQFVRDPTGRLPDRVKWDGDASLPGDARETGYRTGDIELWVARSDRTAVYVRTATDRFERWPLADPPFGCR